MIVAVLAAGGGYRTGDFVGPPDLVIQLYQTTRSIDEKVSRALDEASQRVASSDNTEKDLKTAREEVAVTTKALEERDKELETKEKTSLNLEVVKHLSPAVAVCFL